MNTDSPARAIADPRPIRDIILDARKKSGRTEKQINREYRRHMQEAGRDAPKSIMTKVRDRRRVFSLDSVEARCLAQALDIDADIIACKDAPAAEPEILRDRNPATAGMATRSIDPETTTERVTETSPRQMRKKDNSTLLPPRTYGVAGVSFAEVAGGLRFSIDMNLDAAQLDRLTLAIPAYMMKIRRAGGIMRCQANVPIFPYQAELIMRAIYGGR